MKLWPKLLIVFISVMLVGSSIVIGLTFKAPSGAVSGISDDIIHIKNSNGKLWTATAANLQTAIDDLTTGGTVWLPAGTIECTNSITLGENVSLIGVGYTTILNFSSTGYLKVSNVNNTRCANFMITGRTGYRISAENDCKNHYIENVRCTIKNPAQTGAFFIYANNCTIENIQFKNCEALNCSNFGWMVSGEGTIDRINHLWLDGCYAKDCGRYEYYNNWTTGFDLSEVNSYIENVTVINCIAEGSWESGFHMENGPTKKNIRFTNCISRDNGQKEYTTGYGNPTFGAGFIVSAGMTIDNCHTEDNTRGFLCGNSKSGSWKILDCSDSQSNISIKIEGKNGNAIVNGFTSINAGIYGMYVLDARNVHCAGITIINATGRNDVGYCNIISSSNFQTNDSTFDFHIMEGGENCLLLCQSANNVSLSGTIETEQRTKPISITGSASKPATNVRVNKMHIKCNSTYGIHGNNLVNTIIRDTLIESPYGGTITNAIYSDPSKSGKFLVDANTVTVRDTTNGIYNCNFTPQIMLDAPGTPADGNMYFVTANQTIAVYYSGSWYYYDHL